MTLPKFPRSQRFKQAQKDFRAPELVALADWARELAAAETAGQLHELAAEREGHEADFEIDRT